MISRTYDPAYETFRFAWRNERFVLAVFRLHPGQKRNPRQPPALLGSARQSELAVAAKKLRRSAPKTLESLCRVNLCAGLRPIVCPLRARLDSRPFRVEDDEVVLPEPLQESAASLIAHRSAPQDLGDGALAIDRG